MDLADCRVLGPVELWLGNQPVDIGTPGQRHVLAVLMLSPGRAVTVDELIDRVWGEQSPKQVRNVLYSYVARLRKTWRSQGYVGDPICRTRGGYLLDIAPEAVDCHRFRWRLARAHEPETSNEERRSLLLGAIGEWRGTPLAGLDGEWVARIRYGLAQQRLNALVELADLEIDAGAHGVAIDMLHAVVVEYPLSDALVLRLVRALHRTGRGAEALATYAAFRKRVVSELGAEPGPELQALHREVLRATAVVPSIGEPKPAEVSRWRGLQPHLTRLIGRAEEQAHLTRLLAGERLVTVTGVGGCGKTALALRVGRDVSDRLGMRGAALNLVGSTSAEQIASSLNGLIGGDDDGTGPLTAAERILAAGPWLLVLDNCEHVADAVAGLVARLLGACPKLTVLATSRQPLGVTGETVLTVQPLVVPPANRPADLSTPAAKVFVLRARQAVASIVIGPGDFEDVARICRCLDGLPLALELVAARVRTFTVRELADRLGTDLTLLFRDGTGGDTRHRTLESALGWSFRLLSTPARHLLARLSTFVGGFTMADAEAVCDFPPLRRADVAATLAALVDRSLVQPYDLDGVRRYQLLELVRIFAGERLVELGEGERCECRHLDHRLALARHIDLLPRYAERAAALRALAPDAANLRRCLEHAFTDHPLDAAEIIARNFEFWLVNPGYLAEGRPLLDRALLLPGLRERPEVFALLRFHQALLVSMSGDRLRGLELVRAVFEDLREHRPRECLEGQAALLTAKCMLLDPSVLDEVTPAVAMAQRSESVDDARVVLNAASWVLITWGRYDEASALHRAYDRLGPVHDGSAAAVLSPRVLTALGQADLPAARATADELFDKLAQITHAAEHNDPRLAIAQCYLRQGEVGRAVHFLRESWDFLSTSYPLFTRRFTDLRILLAEAYRRAGDLPSAVRTLGAALRASAGSTDFIQSFTGVLTAALIAHDMGDHAASQLLASRWDSLRRRLGLPVPARFERGTAHLLNLDPAPPARPAEPAWDAVAIADCIADALAWCDRADC